MHGRSSNIGTPLPFDDHSIKRFSRSDRENLTPSSELMSRLRISSPKMSDTGSLPRPGSPPDWAISTKKLDDKVAELAKLKLIYEAKIEKLEIHRCELDAWEKKLSEWKRQMTERHQTLERALEDKIKSHNAQVLAFDDQRRADKEALQSEKDAFRRSRLQAASDLDEQRSVLRYRSKELSEQEKSLGPRLALFDERGAELDEREKKLKAREVDFEQRLKKLQDRESKNDSVLEHLSRREEQLKSKEEKFEDLQKDLRVKLRETEKCLEDLAAKESAILSQKSELDEQQILQESIAKEQEEKLKELQEKDSDFRRREEELSKSLEEASWNIVESERELAEKTRELEEKASENEELSKRLTKWNEELRVQNEKASIRERDLESREEYLSKYFSAFQPM